MTAAVILAAGASTRMGRPKALLPWRGRSLLTHVYAAAAAARCAPVIVVAGAHALEPALAEIRSEGPPGASLVTNVDWARGPLSSLQVGLAAALEDEPKIAGALVMTVDRPRVSAQTLAGLISGAQSAPGTVWQPSYAGRSGHPMLWPRALFARLLALDPARDTARTLARAPDVAALRRKLAVDDPGVLDNVDTPADYQNLGS